MLTHPEEEDAPDQHSDDGHEADGVGDPPHIIQMTGLVGRLALMEAGQKHHQDHSVEPVTPALHKGAQCNTTPWKYPYSSFLADKKTT